MATATTVSSLDILLGTAPGPKSNPKSHSLTSTATIDELEALVAQLWDMVDVTKKELETLKAKKVDFPSGKE